MSNLIGEKERGNQELTSFPINHNRKVGFTTLFSGANADKSRVSSGRIETRNTSGQRANSSSNRERRGWGQNPPLPNNQSPLKGMAPMVVQAFDSNYKMQSSKPILPRKNEERIPQQSFENNPEFSMPSNPDPISNGTQSSKRSQLSLLESRKNESLSMKFPSEVSENSARFQSLLRKLSSLPASQFSQVESFVESLLVPKSPSPTKEQVFKEPEKTEKKTITLDSANQEHQNSKNQLNRSLKLEDFPFAESFEPKKESQSSQGANRANEMKLKLPENSSSLNLLEKNQPGTNSSISLAANNQKGPIGSNQIKDMLLATSSSFSNVAIKVYSTWGSSTHFGMTEIHVFDMSGQQMQILPMHFKLKSSSLSSLQNINQIIDGHIYTTEERHMQTFHLPMPPMVPEININIPGQGEVGALRIWNYNKSPLESLKGIQECRVFIRGQEAFCGRLKKAPGNPYEEYVNDIFAPDFPVSVRLPPLNPPPTRPIIHELPFQGMSFGEGSDNASNVKGEEEKLPWMDSGTDKKAQRDRRHLDSSANIGGKNSSRGAMNLLGPNNNDSGLNQASFGKDGAPNFELNNDLSLKKPASRGSRRRIVGDPGPSENTNPIKDIFSNDTDPLSQFGLRPPEPKINQNLDPQANLSQVRGPSVGSNAPSGGKNAPPGVASTGDGERKSRRDKNTEKTGDQKSNNFDIHDIFQRDELTIFGITNRGRLPFLPRNDSNDKPNPFPSLKNNEYDPDFEFGDDYLFKDIEKKQGNTESAKKLIEPAKPSVQMTRGPSANPSSLQVAPKRMNGPAKTPFQLFSEAHRDFMIPCDPGPVGFRLKIRLYSTWADRHYIGLNGIEFFDAEGDPIKVQNPSLNVSADPPDINILPGYSRDPRVIQNIVDEKCNTSDDFHMWLAPFTPGQPNNIEICFGKCVSLSMIRIWNYSKSRIHASRGARQISMELDGSLIFMGEIKKASGSIRSIEDNCEVILFTQDQKTLQRIVENDWVSKLDDEELAQLQESRVSLFRPSTNGGPDQQEFAFNSRTAVMDEERPMTSAKPKPTAKEAIQENERKLAQMEAKEKQSRERKIQSAVERGRQLQGKVLRGKAITLNLIESWGDPHFIGLTGLEILTTNGKVLKFGIENVFAKPRDLSEKYGKIDDKRKLENLFNGRNQTVSDEDIWLIPFNPGKEHIISITLGTAPVEVTGIRIWNYNKNTGSDQTRGVKRLTIKMDEIMLTPLSGVFVRMAPGSSNISFSQTIELPLSPEYGSGIPPESKVVQIDSMARFVQHYITSFNPTGLMFKFTLISTWSDLFFIGLDRIEFYGPNGSPLLAGKNQKEFTLRADPSSVRQLNYFSILAMFILHFSGK